MRTTFHWRRGLLASVLVGGGIAASAVTGMYVTQSRELKDAPLIAGALAASWGGIAFVLGAMKPAGSESVELTRPSVPERIVDMIWRTMVGLFVGWIAGMVVEAAGLGFVIAIYGDVVPPVRPAMTWQLQLGIGAFMAALTASVVGALTGAWTCRSRVLPTSVRGSVFGICLGCATGAIASFVGGWPTFFFLCLGSGVICGVIGAILARTFIPPAANPLLSDLANAIEVEPSRELS